MDLQKIAEEAVMAAAQAGTVNFNFNDIHHNQNVYLGADGKVGTSAGVDPTEPLSYYITDADLRGRIIDIAENQCTKPQHVKMFVFDELLKAGMRRDMLLSKPFIEALIPHLKKLVCPNVENLQKAFKNNA